jgi:hypothetical protein
MNDIQNFLLDGVLIDPEVIERVRQTSVTNLSLTQSRQIDEVNAVLKLARIGFNLVTGKDG